jgi:hypothetical protein
MLSPVLKKENVYGRGPVLLNSSLKEARAFLVPGERGNLTCEEAFSILMT